MVGRLKNKMTTLLADGWRSDSLTCVRYIDATDLRGDFLFHKQVTNRAAADQLFQITVAYLKDWAEIKGSCGGLHRWSVGFRRENKGSCKRLSFRLPQMCSGHPGVRGEVPASKQLIPELAGCRCHQGHQNASHVKASWDFILFIYFFARFPSAACRGNGPQPHGCFVSQHGLMAVTLECFSQLLQDKILLTTSSLSWICQQCISIS